MMSVSCTWGRVEAQGLNGWDGLWLDDYHRVQ